jgi:N-acetylglutamate synthase-like GNAT family acetyltransferase
MIRDVEKSDTPSIAKLLKDLGYSTSQSALDAKLVSYSQAENTYKVMIDIEDDGINGLIGLQIIKPFHSKGSIGRVTTLVLDESYRGNRAGRMLVEAADHYFVESGCSISEVTGAIMRSNARDIFLGLGYSENDRYYVKQHRARV